MGAIQVRGGGLAGAAGKPLPLLLPLLLLVAPELCFTPFSTTKRTINFLHPQTLLITDSLFRTNDIQRRKKIVALVDEVTAGGGCCACILLPPCAQLVWVGALALVDEASQVGAMHVRFLCGSVCMWTRACVRGQREGLCPQQPARRAAAARGFDISPSSWGGGGWRWQSKPRAAGRCACTAVAHPAPLPSHPACPATARPCRRRRHGARVQRHACERGAAKPGELRSGWAGCCGSLAS